MRQLVRPKKNLGQHFLTALGIARRIADTVDACPDIPVLEVGPGMGVLTQFLAEKPRELAVVEIDKESVEYLTLNLKPQISNLNIIEGDFLRMNLNEVFGGRPFVLTGNYPYDISSQIFFKMLDNRDLIPCCTGMIQHEVALRMAAKPGNKQYGILSVLMQAWYDVEYLFTVEPSVFNPPPKVQSAVIRLTRNGVTDLGCDEQLFRRVVKATFGQRRKMLRVSLRQLLPHPNPSPAKGGECLPSPAKGGECLPSPARGEECLPTDGFFQHDMMTRRPEQLTIAEFVNLTNLVSEWI